MTDVMPERQGVDLDELVDGEPARAGELDASRPVAADAAAEHSDPHSYLLMDLDDAHRRRGART